MKPKNYIFKIVFAVLLLLFIFTSPALALEVQDYPTLPLVHALGNNPSFPDYVAYFFGLGIYVAGILTMISFAFGAVQLIMSAGNPTTAGDGKSRMIGSVLGLVLVLSSALILRTINPQLTTISLSPLPGVSGIYYIVGTEKKAAPMAESDYANVPQGATLILYECDPSNQASAPTLLVWQYQQKNFGHKPDYSDVSVERVPCGGRVNISPSFTMTFETPGVYYFTGTGCKGYGSQVIGAGEGEIIDPFFKNIKSVRIVNDLPNAIFYGVIFHQANDGSGLCHTPIETAGCQPVLANLNPASMDIYVKNNKPQLSGDGVKFYSEEWGWNTGVQGGIYTVSKDQIPFNSWTGLPGNMLFSFSGASITQNYQDKCETFELCHGSIKVQGSYLAVVYSSAPGSSSQSFDCQVFKKDVPNINETKAVPPGYKIRKIQIIPVK